MTFLTYPYKVLFNMGVVNTRDVFPPHQYVKVSTIDFLTITDDECIRHVTLATCYQLAQLV